VSALPAQRLLGYIPGTMARAGNRHTVEDESDSRGS
jgi:hypothetical protein